MDRFRNEIVRECKDWADGTVAWAVKNPDHPTVRATWRGAIKDPVTMLRAKLGEAWFVQKMGGDPLDCINLEVGVVDRDGTDVWFELDGAIIGANVKASANGFYLITSVNRNEHKVARPGVALVLVRVDRDLSGYWCGSSRGWVWHEDYIKKHKLVGPGDGLPVGMVDGTPYMHKSKLDDIKKLLRGTPLTWAQVHRWHQEREAAE